MQVMGICIQQLFMTTVMPQQQSLAQRVFSEIVAIAQSLGGTASGEHGIGSIKSSLVADEISPTVMDLQRSN